MLLQSDSRQHLARVQETDRQQGELAESRKTNSRQKGRRQSSRELTERQQTGNRKPTNDQQIVGGKQVAYSQTAGS